jgi:hypothetical protein
MERTSPPLPPATFLRHGSPPTLLLPDQTATPDSLTSPPRGEGHPPGHLVASHRDVPATCKNLSVDEAWREHHESARSSEHTGLFTGTAASLVIR